MCSFQFVYQFFPPRLGQYSPNHPPNLTKHHPQATLYGKCVVSDYNSIHKDKCAKEFMKLKDCYLVCIDVHFILYVYDGKLHLTYTTPYTGGTKGS